jgi:hypothetical protein
MECFGTIDFDNNSRLITLSVIIISSLHCIWNTLLAPHSLDDMNVYLQTTGTNMQRYKYTSQEYAFLECDTWKFTCLYNVPVLHTQTNFSVSFIISILCWALWCTNEWNRGIHYVILCIVDYIIFPSCPMIHIWPNAPWKAKFLENVLSIYSILSDTMSNSRLYSTHWSDDNE